MAAKYDLAFHLGNTWDIHCECRDADRELITISQAEWRLANETMRFILASTSNGSITITGPGTCTVRVSSAAQAQSGLTRGIYSHELWVLDADTGTDSIQTVGKVNVLDSLKRQFP